MKLTIFFLRIQVLLYVFYVFTDIRIYVFRVYSIHIYFYVSHKTEAIYLKADNTYIKSSYILLYKINNSDINDRGSLWYNLFVNYFSTYFLHTEKVVFNW